MKFIWRHVQRAESKKTKKGQPDPLNIRHSTTDEECNQRRKDPHENSHTRTSSFGKHLCCTNRAIFQESNGITAVHTRTHANRKYRQRSEKLVEWGASLCWGCLTYLDRMRIHAVRVERARFLQEVALRVRRNLAPVNGTEIVKKHAFSEFPPLLLVLLESLKQGVFTALQTPFRAV